MGIFSRRKKKKEKSSSSSSGGTYYTGSGTYVDSSGQGQSTANIPSGSSVSFSTDPNIPSSGGGGSRGGSSGGSSSGGGGGGGGSPSMSTLETPTSGAVPKKGGLPVTKTSADAWSGKVETIGTGVKTSDAWSEKLKQLELVGELKKHNILKKVKELEE